jgi:competence protein ComEA
MPRNLLSALLLSATLALPLAASAADLDINKATEAQLDSVKGLGPVMTRRILEERGKAPFANWSDLIQRVQGIGPRSAEKMSQSGVRVNNKAFSEPAAPPPKAP